MKKTILLLYFLSFFLSGCNLITNNEIQTQEEKTINVNTQTYDYYTESFENISTKELQGFDESDSYFIYTGRSTCPYCRIFVPKLYNASLDTKFNDIRIFYLNSEDELDLGLEDFFLNYDIEFVPNFSYFEGSELVASLEISENTNFEDIKNFITLMTSLSYVYHKNIL